MSDKISPDDFIRLPEGHVLRACDFIYIQDDGLQKCHNTIGCMVGRDGSEYYCRRSGYPQPKRVLHEMALSDNTGMSFCWVWAEQLATHEESGWFATGRTREVTHE
jgi:hypothetical protein